MKFKRASALFLSAVMCMGLVACKPEQPPTAEELLSNGGLQSAESIDVDMNIKLNAKIPMSAIIADNEGSTNLGIDTQVNMLRNANVQKMEGIIGIDLFGMEYSEDMLTYVYTDEDGTATTYTKDSDSGRWTYTLEGTDKGVDTITRMDAGLFSNLTLLPAEKDDLVYTVTGDIALTDFMDQTDADIGDILDTDSVFGDALDGGMFNAVLSYDRKNKQLQDVSLELDPATVSSAEDEMEITNFIITLHVKERNNSEVEIPADVLAEAVEASSLTSELEDNYEADPFVNTDDDGSYDYDSYMDDYEAVPEASEVTIEPR